MVRNISVKVKRCPCFVLCADTFFCLFKKFIVKNNFLSVKLFFVLLIKRLRKLFVKCSKIRAVKCFEHFHTLANLSCICLVSRNHSIYPCRKVVCFTRIYVRKHFAHHKAKNIVLCVIFGFAVSRPFKFGIGFFRTVRFNIVLCPVYNFAVLLFKIGKSGVSVIPCFHICGNLFNKFVCSYS